MDPHRVRLHDSGHDVLNVIARSEATKRRADPVQAACSLLLLLFRKPTEARFRVCEHVLSIAHAPCFNISKTPRDRGVQIGQPALSLGFRTRRIAIRLATILAHTNTVGAFGPSSGGRP